MNYPQCALLFPNSHISPTHILILAKSSNPGQQLSMRQEALNAARWEVSENSERLGGGEEAKLQGGAWAPGVTERPLCSSSGPLPDSLPRHPSKCTCQSPHSSLPWKMLHTVNPEECHQSETDFKVITQAALKHVILRTQNLIEVCRCCFVLFFKMHRHFYESSVPLNGGARHSASPNLCIRELPITLGSIQFIQFSLELEEEGVLSHP